MTDKYKVIQRFHAKKAGFKVSDMCAWLGVSRSGFYDWCKHEPSAAERRRSLLTTQITAVFKASNETYGHRRVCAALRRQGWDVCEELVRKLMRELGLVPCQPAPWRPVTTLPADAKAPDLVTGDFTAAIPGTKLVGDITYIETWEGWLYLATVIDCATKQVIGWATAAHMRAELVCDALRMAARSYPLQPDCIFHSDRGVQYTSDEYRRLLKDLKIRPSVGRTGVCWDNALAESFFAALKNELVHRTVFSTRRQARDAITNYIEIFYNHKRLHSGLDYHTPHEVYLASQLAKAS